MQYVRRRWSATFWRSWRTLLHSRLPCVGRPSSSMLRVGAPAPVPAAPWLGDYPAARADAGVEADRSEVDLLAAYMPAPSMEAARLERRRVRGMDQGARDAGA